MVRRWRLPRLTAEHVSEENLLLHLDGALPRRKQEAVTRHLRDCWRCRMQQERFQQAIGAFMQECEEDVGSLGDMHGNPSGFAARLARVSAERAEAHVEPGVGPQFLKGRLIWILAPAAAALLAFGAWKPILNYVGIVPAPPADSAPPQVPGPRPVGPTTAPIEIPLAVLPPNVRQRVASPPTISEPSLPGRTAGFTAEELDATELAAQVAIHRLGLCRWQAIDVLRLPGRGIRIRGVVERSEQIADLRSALAGVSAIEFELAAPPEDMATVPSDIQMRTRLEPRPPLLERRLEQYFLGQAPRDQVARSIAEFCGRAVELAATAHSEAQALNTLAGAFSEACLQRMSAADRARFLPVAEEHIRELRQSLAQLRVLLDRLEDGSASVEPAPLPSKWEDGCHLVALRTARMDLLIGGLFAGLDLHGLTAGQAWRELRETQERSVVLLDAAGLSLRGSLETGNR